MNLSVACECGKLMKLKRRKCYDDFHLIWSICSPRTLLRLNGFCSTLSSFSNDSLSRWLMVYFIAFYHFARMSPCVGGWTSAICDFRLMVVYMALIWCLATERASFGATHCSDMFRAARSWINATQKGYSLSCALTSRNVSSQIATPSNAISRTINFGSLHLPHMRMSVCVRDRQWLIMLRSNQLFSVNWVSSSSFVGAFSIGISSFCLFLCVTWLPTHPDADYCADAMVTFSTHCPV